MPTPASSPTEGQTITVIIPLAEAPLQDILNVTLDSVGFANEVLVADMVGLYPDECGWLGDRATHLPFHGLPDTAAMYRAALTATSDWLLFLEPGLAIPADLPAKLRAWDAGQGEAVRFGRHWFWHEAQWEDLPAGVRPDFVKRDVYMENTKKWQPLPLKDASEVLVGPIAPTDLLRWADYEGYRVAQAIIKDHGPPTSAMTAIHTAIRDAVRLVLQDGVAKRQAFDGTGRIVLLCRLLKTIGVGLALSTFTGQAGRELAPVKTPSRKRTV